jgi:uncharacterized protein YndB with AHSA1/START domain
MYRLVQARNRREVEVDYERTIEVDAPPEATWQAVADLASWPAWTASIERLQPLDGPQLASGGRFRIKQPAMPPLVWTVTDLQPGTSFSWRSSSAGVTTLGGHRVEPFGAGGSRLILELHQSGPLAKLLGALAGARARRYVDLEAEGLRRAAETGAEAEAG